jgi:3'-phosphoadenosine 5'-phosphosulfate sulfotransferase (PAPS reductase)/FAD synthetase
MIELMKTAAAAGAHFLANISGGKDGQAMTRILVQNGFTVHGLIHADLGEIEWHQSIEQCRKQSQELQIPLHVTRRNDGLGLLQLIERRKQNLDGTGKPFWPSSSTRYCTSDTKRDPINVFYRNHTHDFIISCVGIRASESTSRAKKSPLEINTRASSTFYKGMTVQQAIENYKPGKRLVIQWFPIFNFSDHDVWNTYGVTAGDLAAARAEYKATGTVPGSWPFHAAYVFGNNRVSCVICPFAAGSDCNDIRIGAIHRPELVATLSRWEDETGFTYIQGKPLKSFLTI